METLFRKSFYDLVLSKGVSTTFKSVASLNQFCQTIGSIFDFMTGFGCSGARVEEGHGDELVVGTDSIMNIFKVADDLPTVLAVRAVRTSICKREQCEMKGLAIRAIDNRDLVSDPRECLAAVRTRFGILIQQDTPVTAPMMTKTPASCDEYPKHAELHPRAVVEKYDGGLFHVLQAKHPS
jgi:hypothetical protein